MSQTTLVVIAIIVLVAGTGLLLMSNDSEPKMDVQKVAEHADDLESFEISPGEVVKKVRSGADVILLDVRTKEEYEEIHLENAVLLPVQELSQDSLARIGLGEDAKDKEIIIYCRSGARSKTAYDIMKSLGYTNIKSIGGGMIHWQEDKYPLTETGAYTGKSTVKDDDDQTAKADGPKIAFDRKLHDFGIVPQFGGVVRTSFRVENEGTETLEIGDITTSCSCTSAEIASASIESGDEAVLTVIFNPNLHEEPFDVFKRTIFIKTNDPNTPEAEVVVQVDIAEGE